MSIESEYRARVDAMTVVERVRRTEELFRWSRDYLARLVRAELGPVSGARLEREVALRLYGHDARTRALIEALPLRDPD